MNHRKQPERRTFLQDRFEILIKRQKSGTATFNELTELDEIVNRDPELREKIIREDILMEGLDDDSGPANKLQNEIERHLKPAESQNLLAKIRAYLSGLFTIKISLLKNKITPAYRQVVLL